MVCDMPLHEDHWGWGSTGMMFYPVSQNLMTISDQYFQSYEKELAEAGVEPPAFYKKKLDETIWGMKYANIRSRDMREH